MVAAGIPSPSKGPPQKPPEAAATLYSWRGSVPSLSVVMAVDDVALIVRAPREDEHVGAVLQEAE